MIALVALLLAPAEIELPSVQRGDVTARLAIRVADRAAGPGRAEVRYAVDVQGPAWLEVGDPLLEDALAGWRVRWQASSWETGRAALTLGLVQVKPGTVPLPGLRLRVRGSPSEAWEEVSWPDPLQEPADVAPLVELPPLPAAAWHRWAIAAGAVATLLLVVVLMRLLRRERVVLTPMLTASQRALTRIDEAATIEDVTQPLRELLEARTNIPATRRTTTEVLALLVATPDVQAELRELFALSDQAKFAGRIPSPDVLTEAKTRARALVTGLSSKAVPAGETAPVGEVG